MLLAFIWRLCYWHTAHEVLTDTEMAELQLRFFGDILCKAEFLYHVSIALNRCVRKSDFVCILDSDIFIWCWWILEGSALFVVQTFFESTRFSVNNCALLCMYTYEMEVYISRTVPKTIQMTIVKSDIHVDNILLYLYKQQNSNKIKRWNTFIDLFIQNIIEFTVNIVLD